MISAKLLDSMPLRCNPTLGLQESMLVSVLSVHTMNLAVKVSVTSA